MHFSVNSKQRNVKPVFLKLSWAVGSFKRLSTLVAPCSSIKIPISRQS